jgi:hypothetical protein
MVREGQERMRQRRPGSPEKPLGEWNRFHITMRGDRVSVLLNGQPVIENEQLPGIDAGRSGFSTTTAQSNLRIFTFGS